MAGSLRLPGPTAVEVISVDPGGPGAGVMVGDLIIRIVEQNVSSLDDLHRFLTEFPFGQHTTLMVIRGRNRLQLPVIPAAAPRI